MRKKYLFCFAAALLAAFLAAGCKKSVGTPEDNAIVEEDTDEEEETGSFLVGFSCADMDNAFYAAVAESAENTLNELDGELTVKDAGKDIETQIEQVKELIAAGADAVLLCPADAEGITPALEALSEAGIPVINLDVQAEETSLVDACIRSDNYTAGYRLGEDLLERLPDGGSVVLAEDSDNSTVNECITGFEEALSEGIFTIAERIDVSDTADLQEKFEEIFSGENLPDAVMCGSDEAALSVIAAAEAVSVTDVLVYSVGGSPEIKTAIAEGTGGMTGTSALTPIDMGKTAAETAAAMINGEKYEDDVTLETVFIDRENVDLYGTDAWQ